LKDKLHRGEDPMSLRVGKIIGVEIKLHYTWFVIFTLVTWTLAQGYMPRQYPGLSPALYWVIGATAAVILFASVLFHELCHSYVAKRQGLSVPAITLFLFGGVSQIAEEPPNPDFEFKMALVGPLSSFGLAALLGVAWYGALGLNLKPELVAPLQYGALINVLLGVFNLIPAFPLDGGRLLRAKVWKWKDDLVAATRLSVKVSEGFAYALMFTGFLVILFGAWIGGLWLIFIGWFLRNGAEASLRQTIIGQALSDVVVGNVMTPQVVAVEPHLTVEKVVEEYFYRYKHGGFPVVQGGRFEGMVTVHDVRKFPKESWRGLSVRDIMTPAERIISVKPDEPAVEAMIKLSRHDVGRLPVLKEGRIVGIITRSDLMKVIKTRTALRL